MNPNDKVSTHFTWGEVTFSETAIRHGINNTPPEELMPNINRMAKFMEQVRYKLAGRPILISSWYRSPEVNRLIGGATKSNHVKGIACDFVCPTLGSPLRVAQELENSDLDYDQLIHEFGRWVHIGLSEGHRRESLTAYLKDGKIFYEKGLKEVP